MKRYISEIFITDDNINEKDWINLIYAISNLNGLLKKWTIYVRIKLNKVQYYIETNKTLPTIINGQSKFLIKQIEVKKNYEDEYKIRNYIIPYFTRNNEQNIFDLYDKNEIKYFRNLTLTKIEIIPYKRDNFVSFTYFYFLNKNNQIVKRRGIFSIPFKLLSADFSKQSRFFYSKESSQYLNIKKSINVMRCENIDSIAKIDAFPYLSENYYLNLENYDFDRHSIIIGASGTGKSKFISHFIEKVKIYNERHEEKYKIVLIDPHASIEKDIGGLEDSKILNFETIENSLDLFVNSKFNIKTSTELILELCKNLLSEIYNSKLERVLRYSIMLLLQKDKFNFTTLRKLLLNLEYRNKLLENEYGELPDNVVEFFLTDFNELKTKSYQEAISPILSFVDEMQELEVFRCQENLENLENIIKQNFLSVFSLNQIALGEKTTKTISGFIMQQMMQLVQSYAFKEHVIFIVDEVSIVENSILRRFLSEARKYNLSLILTQQYFNQISKELQTSIFANIINYYIFRLSKIDAMTLSGTLQMELPANSKISKNKILMQLNNRELIIRISSHGKILSAFKAKTLDFTPMPKVIVNQILSTNIMKRENKTNNENKRINIINFKGDIDLKTIMRSQSTSREELYNNG